MVPPGVAEGVQLRLFFPYFLGLLLLAPLLFYWLARSPRRLPPRWRRLLLGLRLATFVLLVAALLRLVLAQAADQANVVFLLDMSHSVATAVREQALEFIRAVSRAKRPRDGVGLVVFGAEAALEHAVSHSAHFTEVASEVEGTSTNIAAALRLGLASFPPRGARRLVLLSDGNENVESALEAAVVAGSLGAPVFPVPLAPLAGDAEVRAEKLVVPPQVAAGAPYQVEAVVSSTHETPASLELFRGGVFVGRHEVVLQPGKNRFSFRQQTDEEGVHLFELVVNSARDTVADNNRWQAFTEVVGPPKVLVLYEQPEHAGYLVEALRQQGLAVETRPWSDLPHALSGYLRYDALIFDNVPGFGISVSQMEILERYVRDMGGGLLMVGGEKSFGAGGYYRTPLEKVLPVDMDVPTKMSIPSLCLVMVIDRSDSMGGSVDGGNGVRRFDDRTTKLEVAKIAAFSALKLLNPFDQVGLLAFNADWEWTVPISEGRQARADRRAALGADPRWWHRPLQGAGRGDPGT
ncbi:MAG: hypothetical protein KatS3mg131_0657 [Candidatus Tectimicrobiota bacterium]|nr:MAG: hypothetical protein KatS3mg131_0657 [Candidatus Tectomicrobia bacterium]